MELPDEFATLSPTGYALLGLLMFAGRTDTAVTAYELKQRADRTLRYYWVAPAMSQVYSEMSRLVRAGLAAAVDDDVAAVAEPAPDRPASDAPAADAPAGRRPTRYVITDAGERVVRHWLTETPAEFPVLKHPVALRLLMGHLATPDDMTAMLRDYLTELDARRADLRGVREMLADRAEVQYPAMVADWGLAYYDAETRIVTELLSRVPPAAPDPGTSPRSTPDTGR